MIAKLRVGKRLRAKLRGEVRVYGLRAPALLRFDGGPLELQDDADRAIASGFAAAERGMLPLDLERRLWSGRLAELLGTTRVAGLPAPDLDVFIRLIGLRWDAKRLVKALEPAERARLDAVAAGLNAWIDARRWESNAAWKELGSRPRLFGAVDLMLLATARHRAARMVEVVPAPPAEWPTPWTSQLQARLDAARGATRAGEVGAGSDALREHLPRPDLPPTEPAALQVEEVLPGGDDHRVVHEDGWVRLRVRRPDVAVRGANPLRPWLRRSPRGPLVSDLLAPSDTPATGRAFSFAWESGDGAARPRGAASSGGGTLRLVPLTEGA
ncbi:MAG: penicillin acylase family protein [Deltaproteobacteria bacterium]|nr:penicillin acylase family protein [Deltaproteobacteria bacterium]